MAELRFATMTNAVKGFMNLPLTRQLVMLGALALSIALGYSVVTWLYQTDYRPLLSNLDNKDIAAIAEIFEKNRIEYKISDRDGAILVPINQEKEAKLKLFASGYMESNNFNFDKFQKEGGLGSSRFLENMRYNKALEGELARTIMAIQGIKAARVHLAIPKPSVFVGQDEAPSASVMVELMPGYDLDKSQTNAIVQLVAGSVIGLKPADVTITDQLGRLLTTKLDTDLALSEEQLDYQKQVQDYYEKRIQSMIAPLIGADKLQVRVFANIDFTHNEKTEEQFKPDDKALKSEQTLTEQNSGGGGGGGAPGALSNQPPETGGAAPSSGGGGGGGSSRNQNSKTYEVSKTMSYSRSPIGKMVNLSVAVVVDNETVTDPKSNKNSTAPLPPDKVQKITDLVKAAVGFDDKRGDKVSVINAPFVMPEKIELPPEPPFYKQSWFWDIMEKASAVMVTLLIAFGVIKPLLRNLAGANSGVAAVEEGEQGERIVLTPEMQKMKQQQLESLKQLASKDPTKVAGVLKNWVSGGNEP